MALYLICMDTSEVLLKSKLTDFSSVKIRYRNEPWFKVFLYENGVIGRCSNAGLREVGKYFIC